MPNTAQIKKSFTIPRRTLSIVIILATLAAAVYYLYKHQNLVTDLKNIPPYVIIEVLALYILMLFVLVLIFKATMKLVNVEVKRKENILINIYSLFMNFFIPGQTGPALRAYYMKKDHNLKYLDYTVATIIYYLLYGLLSAVMIVAGSQPYYLSLPLITLGVLVAALGLRIYLSKHNQTRINLTPKILLFVCFATLCQIAVQTVIYAIEISSVQSGIHISQILTYTGTANLALFVALTPGAIGIRESFLILTRNLHHIPASTTVLANVIDRSVYIVFLLIIGLVLILLNIKSRLDSFAKQN